MRLTKDPVCCLKYAAAETAAALAVAAVAAVAGLRCSPLQFRLSAQQQGRTRQLFTGYYKTLAQPRLYIEIKRVIVEFMQTLNYLSDLFFHFLTCSLVSVTHIVRFRIERSFFDFFCIHFLLGEGCFACADLQIVNLQFCTYKIPSP